MKKNLLVFTLALGAAAGATLYLDHHWAVSRAPGPAPATAGVPTAANAPAPRAPETAPGAASRHTTTAGPHAGAATRPVPRMQAGEHRLTRADLTQVLPGVVAPPPDWRTFAPTKLTVTPLPDLPLDFTATSITNDGKRTTWIGTNGTEGATLVACATETLWDAIITIPGADEYSVQITPDLVRVFERGHAGEACGPIEGLAQALQATGTTANGQAAAAVSAATAVSTSDLLVLYDAGTKNDWGSAAETENRISAVVTAMNTYLEQSKVDNLRWRLVGTVQAPAYPTTTVLEDDLDRMDNSSTELGRFVDQQRALYGADQVQLIVAGTRDYAGIAFTPGYLSVVHHPGTAATAAHELAHNFGCHHDRQTQTEAKDGDGKYYYGHRYTQNGQDTGTIMSYAPYLVPYYSNPDITYQGVPVGVAAGQPRAADNARWLREHAADIANLVASKVVTAPTITTQPVSVTVTAGQSFSLSVTATGNSLSYQWAKDGAALSGATAATYSKGASSTTDSGSYSVVVSNSAGSVSSAAATVTVNAAPVTPPPPTTPPTSGGGGGGAVDLITVLGALTLLTGAARHRRN